MAGTTPSHDEKKGIEADPITEGRGAHDDVWNSAGVAHFFKLHVSWVLDDYDAGTFHWGAIVGHWLETQEAAATPF